MALLWEHRMWQKLARRPALWLIIACTLLGLGCRLSMLDHCSADADLFLLPWFEEIRQGGGFAALKEQVGDYNIPYQTIICLLTYLPGEPLHLFKMVSYLFDVGLALSCGGFAMALLGRRSSLLFAGVYGAVLLFPTNILNSAVFAQCDSIYACFAVLGLWMLYRRQWIFAYLFFGLSFSFKLQVVLLFPFLLYHYFSTRKYTILHFLLIPGVLYFLSLPALCLGRSWLEPITIYFSQTDTYQQMWMNFPSFWSLVGNNYDLKRIAILLTFSVLLFGFCLLLKRRIFLLRPSLFLKAAAWVVWSCLLFLPSMHERYGYLLDLLLFLVMLTDRSCWVFPAVTLTISTITYGWFLFGNSGLTVQFLTLLYLSAYLWFSYRLISGKSGKPVLCRLNPVSRPSNEPDSASLAK